MYNIAQALAAPVIFTWKRRSLILYPLTLREWVLLDDTFQKPDDIDPLDIVVHALWLSVRKDDTHVSRKWINRWCEKQVDALILIWNRLIEISMPPPPEKEASEKEATLLRQSNVGYIFGVFAELYNWDANIVGNLTPLQLCMYLDVEAKREKTTGVNVGSLSEARKVFDQMRKKGPLKKA